MPLTDLSSLGCWRGISSKRGSIGVKKASMSSGSTSLPKMKRTRTLEIEDAIDLRNTGVDSLENAAEESMDLLGAEPRDDYEVNHPEGVLRVEL